MSLSMSASSASPYPPSAPVGAVDVLATLESIDSPSSTASYDDVPPLDLRPAYPQAGPPSASPAQEGVAPGPTRRISRLPPPPTIYPGYYATASSSSWTGSAASGAAGPSRQQRYFYVGVRRGHQQGVYTCWSQAEKQIIDHPSPVFKTFSTRFAAEAYISGWDGAGRHSLPSSSPRPLREHLAMNFPSSVTVPSSSTSRPSYHARLLSPSIPPTDAGTLHADFGPRPALTSRNSSSYRHSLVKVSSPLRQQVDDSAAASPSRPPVRKSSSFMSVSGLLSPPASPEDMPKPPPAQWNTVGAAAGDRGRAFRPRSMMQGTAFALNASRPPTPPTSPPTSPVKRPPPKRTASGLWADAIPATPSSLSSTRADAKGATAPPDVDLSVNAMAPKFSRSGLKKSGVVMPVSAPRSNSSSSLSSLRGKSSKSSLRLDSPSSSSLSSMTSRTSTIRRQSKSSFASQDRLSSLAETSRKELQLNEEGLLALDSLSPPRPAFMRQRSNSSLSSLSSLTSAASSAQASSLDSCDPIVELDERAVASMGHQADMVEELDTVDELGALVISCTKSDADADGSVESSSMKSGFGGKGGRGGSEAKKKGGLFKRLTKALKLEKKNVPGNESGRRGSM